MTKPNMQLIPAGTWVAVVPTIHKCLTTKPEPVTAFYWLTEPTFIEALMDPKRARLILGVVPFDGISSAKNSGHVGPAVEIDSDGEIAFGRELFHA